MTEALSSSDDSPVFSRYDGGERARDDLGANVGNSLRDKRSPLSCSLSLTLLLLILIFDFEACPK